MPELDFDGQLAPTQFGYIDRVALINQVIAHADAPQANIADWLAEPHFDLM